MTVVLTPPEIKETTDKIIFLAGPIQGSSDWQKEAIAIISEAKKEVTITSPRKEYLDGTFVYNDQVDLETHFLNQAAKNGVILFWLAKESENVPGRAYAQTSRFEIGEWKVRNQLGLAKLVVGIEEGFSGAKYIKRRFMQDCPGVEISDNLRDTCLRALNIL